MPSIFRRAIAVTRTKLNIARQHQELTPRLGDVEFGDFGRVKPISSVFGLDRSEPIDRYYIESFLAENRYDADRWGDYWRLTDQSARKLFEAQFLPENVTVTTYGNALSATSFLEGLAAGELSHVDLDVQDPDYQLVVAVSAVKARP